MKSYEKKLPANRLVAEDESENSAIEEDSAQYVSRLGELGKNVEEENE